MNVSDFVKRAFGKCKRTAFKIICEAFSVLPKKKDLWLFGAWEGRLYADNTKYLFEYITKHHPEKNCVWVTENDGVFDELTKKGYNCVKKFSVKGICYAITAEAAFETEGDWDISPFLNPKKTVTFQLWHGMGVKAMNWNSEKKRKKLNKRFRYYHWAATSELYINVLSELTDSKKENFYITGYPRNDTFVTKPKNEAVENIMAKYPGRRFVIYMPTHRNFGNGGNKHINIRALLNVDKKLAEENIIMVYKPHFHELKNFLAFENDFSNIILAKDENIWADVYSYLHYFDLLITDYSSAASDFMCSGKPVIYFAYDIEDYMTGDAGLNGCFWEIPGGPVCKTWDETIAATVKLLEDDVWKDERERCRAEYHKYNDGKNCERVFEFAESLIKG